MAFKVLESQILYKGRVFELRKEQVRLPDGTLSSLDIIMHPGAIGVLPVDSSGQIWFVRQYRHATKETIWELPAGTLEVGETPADCAQRELREEIGMGAHKLDEIGDFYLAPGYSSERIHVFLGVDLFPDSLTGDVDEQIDVDHMPVSAVYALVEQGQIRDAKSLAILFLARPYLQKMGWVVEI